MRSLSIIVAVAGLMFDGTRAAGGESADRPAGLAIVSLTDGETSENFLTAVLRWDYPLNSDLTPWWDISLEISRLADLSQPFIKCDLPRGLPCPLVAQNQGCDAPQSARR